MRVRVLIHAMGACDFADSEVAALAHATRMLGRALLPAEYTLYTELAWNQKELAHARESLRNCEASEGQNGWPKSQTETARNIVVQLEQQVASLEAQDKEEKARAAASSSKGGRSKRAAAV